MNYTNTLGRLLTALCLFAGLLAAPAHAEKYVYYHLDALGSPVAVTDQQGTLLWREDYKPYGDRILNDPAAANNARWYTGHVQDPDTELVYAGARYYDPEIGRFMAVDSISFQEQNAVNTFNRYTYAANNPYRYVDKDGKCYSSGDIESYMGPDFLDCYVGEGGELLSVGTGVYGLGRLGVRMLAKSLARVSDDVIKLPVSQSWSNSRTLADHFARHGKDFGARNPTDYAQKASDFLQRGIKDKLPTKVDKDGVIRMYDPKSNTFGAYNPDGTTRTLFKPTSPTYFERQPGTAPW